MPEPVEIEPLFEMRLSKWYLWHRLNRHLFSLIAIGIVSYRNIPLPAPTMTNAIMIMLIALAIIGSVISDISKKKYTRIQFHENGISFQQSGCLNIDFYTWNQIEIVKRRNNLVWIKTAKEKRLIAATDYSRRDWLDFCKHMHRLFPKTFGFWQKDDVHPRKKNRITAKA